MVYTHPGRQSHQGFPILGPLFFVIFISDIPDHIPSQNTIALYADDCKTCRIIGSP